MNSKVPLFDPGIVVATPRCLKALGDEDPAWYLGRHLQGDWGLVGIEDWYANGQALKNGSRLFSVYRTKKGVKFWVITEADRSSTCFLLPSDY